MKITRLKSKHREGAGLEIYGFFTETQDCAEFVMKKGYQQVLQCEAILGYEPWVQFEPKKRKEVMSELFKQMVDAWNEKYAINKIPEDMERS